MNKWFFTWTVERERSNHYRDAKKDGETGPKHKRFVNQTFNDGRSREKEKIKDNSVF